MTIVLTVEHTAPGGWLAAVIPGRLAVVHRPALDDGLAQRLWAALGDDDGIRLVIDELARQGLTRAPGFVLAEWEGDDTFDGRFFVRGEAGVMVETASGSEDITARGVSTWVERPVTGVRGFRIECLPSEPGSGVPLPLSVGTAWVSSIAFGTLAAAYEAEPTDIPSTEWIAPPALATAAPDPAAPHPGAVADSGDVAPDPRDADPDRTIADLESTVAAPADEEPVAEEERSVDEEVAPVAAAADRRDAAPASDQLFGATLVRDPADPAGTVDPVPAPDPVPGQLGDHDGLTVMSGDLKAMRDSAQASPPVSYAPQPAVAFSHDAGFVLQLPDGSSEPIDGMVVVGRAPSVSKMGGGRVPRLVTVDSLEHDISRNHVQLTVEGGTVVVTDLHSRNGTHITLPGKSPQKLRAGDPTSIIAGTVIDLGSGVTLGVVQA